MAAEKISLCRWVDYQGCCSFLLKRTWDFVVGGFFVCDGVGVRVAEQCSVASELVID